MTEENKKPDTEGLDFYKGYKVHDKKAKPFPGLKTGEPRVLFEEEVFKELKKHASETVAVELCGVLVGKTCKDDSGNYLIISSSVRGKYSRNEGAQVVFTHETWDYIHSEIEDKHKNLAIVGWYHTHPGFGIFLSDMDKFIQDYFFNQPFQVALVLDPVNKREGLFAWIDGKTRALSKCWIGKEPYELTQGAVGSEEIKDKMPSQLGEEPGKKPGENSPVNLQAVEKSVEVSSAGFGILHLVLAFLVGLSIASIMLRNTFFYSAMLASRAETREILGSWAADTAAAEDINLVSGKMERMAENYSKMLENPDEFASAGASFSIEISEIQKRLNRMASDTADRRLRTHRMLEVISNKNLVKEERSEQILAKMKTVFAQSQLMQILPYLHVMSVSSPDTERIKEARMLINNILSLDPRLEPQLREQIPWLFN